jgi:hypothetical protein
MDKPTNNAEQSIAEKLLRGIGAVTLVMLAVFFLDWAGRMA